MNRLSIDEVNLIQKFVKEDTNFLVLQCFKLVNKHVYKDDISLVSVTLIQNVLRSLTNHIHKLNMQYSLKARKFIYRITDIVYQTFERYYVNSDQYYNNVQILAKICTTIKKKTFV